MPPDGGLGVSPSFFKVPQEWGIQGVDKSVYKRSLKPRSCRLHRLCYTTKAKPDLGRVCCEKTLCRGRHYERE